MEEYFKKTQKKYIFKEAILTLLITLPFAISFGILSNDSAYYFPCSKLSSSYEWAHITFIVLVIVCIMEIAFLPIITLILLNCINMEITSSGFVTGCIIFINIIRVGLAVITLVCFGGLCHAYGEGENCGKLQDLILAYIIMVGAGIGLICVGGCCYFCIGTIVGALALNKGNLRKHLENSGKDTEGQPIQGIQGTTQNHDPKTLTITAEL